MAAQASRQPQVGYFADGRARRLAVVLAVDRMFVRVKKIGQYEYLYLVENAREGGRHVQRTVKALGRREEVEASGMLDFLVASAARHSRRSIVLSAYYRGELDEVRRASIGPDLIFGRLGAVCGRRRAAGVCCAGSPASAGSASISSARSMPACCTG